MKNAILGFLIGFLLVIFGADMAHGQSETLPIYPTDETAASISTALKMACGRVLVENNLIGATKLAVNLRAGFGVSTHVGFGIYPDTNGGTPLAVIGGLSGVSAGVVFTTGLPPFNLTGGLVYRVCFCADSNVGTYAAPNWVPSTGFGTLANVFVNSVGSASNPCTGNAIPPSNTGVLVGDATLFPPLLLVSVE